MKKEWRQTMREGTEEQKAEQWKKFAAKMNELGAQMANFKPGDEQGWDIQGVKKERREKRE